jgi:KDO2-lipid IV(A) lauroyltransferase
VYSFPNLKKSQLKELEVRFYRYFCDLIVESLKAFTISEAELKRRLVFEDTSPFQKHFDNGQSLMVMMGHWGNWELGGLRFSLEDLHDMYVVYKPQKSEVANRLAGKLRTRFGNGLYKMKRTLRLMIEHKDALTATSFLADQLDPSKDALRIEFLQQETKVFQGGAKIAKKLNYPIIYAGIRRVGRGQYSICLEELVAEPSQMEVEEIVKLFFARLERDINQQPETWLWTHKRWKHTRHK